MLTSRVALLLCVSSVVEALASGEVWHARMREFFYLFPNHRTWQPVEPPDASCLQQTCTPYARGCLDFVSGCKANCFSISVAKEHTYNISTGSGKRIPWLACPPRASG